MSSTFWLLLAGGLIIGGLGLYAWQLWRQVWRREAHNREQLQARNHRLQEDLRILAGSLLDEQLPLIEGCIRIKVLLDNYQGKQRSSLPDGIFSLIYDATAHIPTHQAWKDLPREQRLAFEQLMMQLEETHRTAIEQAARELQEKLR